MIRLANAVQLAFVCGAIAPLAKEANLNVVVVGLEGRRSWLIGGDADEAVEFKGIGGRAVIARFGASAR